MEYEYVKCKGKKRVNNKKYTKEQVTAPDFVDDYGRIVPSGYVVFDFDKQPYINIISNIIEKSNLNLKCKKLITSKGAHYMFKTNLDKVSNVIAEFNWIGIQCDVKGCGLKENKQSYQAIKVNGEVRKEQYIHCNSDEELDYAPKWLYPIKNKKDQVDLTIDQTGNRNNFFFKELKVKSKKYKFAYEEYCEVAHIINNFVLPEGLDENELDNSIREEKWDELQITEEKMLLLDMARDVIEHWNCKIFNGTLIFFDENLGHYSNNENTIFCYIQEKYAEQNIRKSQMTEVITQMDIQLNHYEKYKCERNSEYIVCKDKLVSVWENKVINIDRNIVTDIYYPFAIMTEDELNIYNGIGKKFLDDISCNNIDIATVICECLGCMLAPTNHFGKIFIWYGNGNNGKSVLIKIMKAIMNNLLTNANILSVNDRFGLSRAYKGIANVTDDVGITTIRETGTIKSIIDGSAIEVDRKYRDPIDWVPNSQFVMCCNEIPHINDTTKGMIRRLAFIPFDMQLTESEVDRDLFNKILGKSKALNDDEKNDNAIRYIMTKAIIAYRKAYQRGHLTILEKQKELLSTFEEENKDSITLFYDYLVQREGNIDNLCKWLNNKLFSEVFDEYKNFIEIDVKISQMSFSRNFRKLLPSRIRKKAVRLGNAIVNKYILE